MLVNVELRIVEPRRSRCISVASKRKWKGVAVSESLEKGCLFEVAMIIVCRRRLEMMVAW